MDGDFTDKKMIESCIDKIQKAGLDKPFPLKYTCKKFKSTKMNFVSLFVGDYEQDAIWMHMGPLYVQVVSKIDKKKAKEYTLKYKSLIEKHKNFLEVFDSKGEVFKTLFYYSDESMLWAANYLSL